MIIQPQATKNHDDIALTSEQVLGLPSQPHMSCSEIDKAVEKVSKSYTNLRVAATAAAAVASDMNHDCCDENMTDLVDKVTVEIEWAQYEIDGIDQDIEYCRSQCEDLREWGQAWKDLAKDLIQMHDPDTHAEIISQKE